MLALDLCKGNKTFARFTVLPLSWKRLAVSTFWDLNFPPKPCGNCGNCGGEITQYPMC